ncbi:hypothetical protein LTR39_002492, partial [Cryomyces antarcticus]
MPRLWGESNVCAIYGHALAAQRVYAGCATEQCKMVRTPASSDVLVYRDDTHALASPPDRHHPA